MQVTDSMTYLYSIRLLIRHKILSAQEITKMLEVEPTYSWSGGTNGHENTMWSLETWTQGRRFFFEELTSLIDWLEGKSSFLNAISLDEGAVVVIVQLPGQLNIGDELSPKIMFKAATLGISIGIEVFPNLQQPS